MGSKRRGESQGALPLLGVVLMIAAILVMLLALLLPARADEPKLTGEATAPIHHERAKPSVSPEARAKYWRAYAELQAAKALAAKSEAAVNAAVDLLNKECAETTVMLGKDGEPACAPKATAAPATAPAN